MIACFQFLDKPRKNLKIENYGDTKMVSFNNHSSTKSLYIKWNNWYIFGLTSLINPRVLIIEAYIFSYIPTDDKNTEH